ncbi:hypothetical protein C7974DRAFT_208269 [Boeremia exigua]|uniref:uncharacterized protein n=1 Tax=Boeremia exigua TaxID=749465 RepID=UPI001E8ED0DA|nr:uncharacterized protein C7974DRAFT_208269 [Boeremia exigua]KAH6625832.1 hypothetical protein C7974DRAFT_208269 [Boeremia exigua]
MTKDWDVVQDEIKELSFNQKKPLEEVKELMERKYKFRASTRAYRMKLKEWGLMRHKGRKPRLDHKSDSNLGRGRDIGDEESPALSAEPMSVDTESVTHRTNPGEWQAMSSAGLTYTQPPFTGSATQTPTYVSGANLYSTTDSDISLVPSIEIPAWVEDPPTASKVTQDMIAFVLDNECAKLEKLLMEHMSEVNDPIGMPFEAPNSRFANHPVLTKMDIMQHPHQTLLDIASAMPNGPVVWVLLSYGAKGSTHPSGVDLALHNAIRNDRAYTVQALLIPGRSEVNGLPNQSWKPLLQAVAWAGPNLVSILIKRGARVNDAGLSPASPGIHTALQICLELRAREYGDEVVRDKCNKNLKLLLDAGASIHASPPEGSSAFSFEKFIEPWHDFDHWNMRLSWEEMECLGKFVEKGADLSAKFFGSPCAAESSNTFLHQAIWHSPPCISRQVLHRYRQETCNSGVSMLHEVVGVCPVAKRHYAGALEDVETLLSRGVDPNGLNSQGMTPLRACIEQASDGDVLALAQKLLDAGADPEYEHVDGVRSYVAAALTLAEPTCTEVLQAMLRKMQGHSTRSEDGRTYRWEAGLFPIPERPDYQQLLSCTKLEGDLQLSIREMAPIDVHSKLQRAYFAVISSRLLDNVARSTVSNKVSESDRWNLMLSLSLRKAAGLPNYQFDQALVVALLDFPNIDVRRLDSITATTPQTAVGKNTEDITPRTTPLTDSSRIVTPVAYPPFQLNTRSPSMSSQLPSASGSVHASDTSNDAFVGDTTQIRWPDPESQRRPIHTAPYVLKHKCSVCADDRLLTNAELHKHEVEHEHTAGCDGVGCARRFCKETRRRKTKDVGFQEHISDGNV